ncbi:MAG: hypothetical protein ACR2QW_15720, partial [bacterium]
MKRLGLLRFIPLWPVLLLGLLVLLWNQRLEIATWVLDRVVIGGDIQDLGITPAQIDLNRSVIETVEFTALVGGQKYRINASGVDLKYKFLDWKSFFLESINLDRLSINQLDFKQVANDSAASIPPLEQLIANTERLPNFFPPAQSMVVKKLDLSLPHHQFTLENASLHLSTKGKQINARFDDGPRYVTASIMRDEYSIRLGLIGTKPVEVLSVDMYGSVSGNDLSLETTFDSETLSQWISNYVPLESAAEALSDLQARPSITINLSAQDQGYLAEIFAISDQIAFGGARVSGFTLSTHYDLSNLPIEKPDLRIALNTFTTLSATSVEFDKLKITGLDVRPAGHIEKKDGKFIIDFDALSKATAVKLEFGEYSAEKLDLVPDIVIMNNSIQFRQGLTVKAQQVKGPGVEFKHSSVSPQKPSKANLNNGHGFVHKNGHWALQTELSFGEDYRAAGTFDIALSHIDDKSLKGRITSDHPNLSLDFPLPTIQRVSSEIMLLDDVIEVVGTVELDQSDTPLDISAAHNISSGTGTGQLKSQSAVDVQQLLNIAQTMEIDLPETLAIETGEFEIVLDAAWDQDQFTIDS